MRNWKKLLTLPPVVLFLSFGGAAAQIVSQSEIGPNGCGPCALVNSYAVARALKALSALEGESNIDKVRSFIADYGSAPSVPYGKARTAYSYDNGVADNDLEAMIERFASENDLPSPIGQHVVRRADESPEEFLSRVRRSLIESIDNGFHPLLSVRSLVAEYDEGAKKRVWNSKGGHWIAVHLVEETDAHAKSFSLKFSDSLSGEFKTGIAYREVDRKARVPMRFTVTESGKERWEWVSNTETLTLFSVGMPLGTSRARWDERAFIAIRYMISLPTKASVDGLSH